MEHRSTSVRTPTILKGGSRARRKWRLVFLSDTRCPMPRPGEIGRIRRCRVSRAVVRSIELRSSRRFCQEFGISAGRVLQDLPKGEGVRRFVHLPVQDLPQTAGLCLRRLDWLRHPGRLKQQSVGALATLNSR